MAKLMFWYFDALAREKSRQRGTWAIFRAQLFQLSSLSTGGIAPERLHPFPASFVGD
jgi:hypothetical protein